MSRKAPLFGVLLYGGLAFVISSSGQFELPSYQAYVPSPSSIATGSERLRFDGLYQGTTYAGNSLFLRFYPEGDVVTMAAQALSVDEVAEMIDRQRSELARGTYHLHGAGVSFVATNSMDSIDYEGNVGRESIVCLIRSHITDREETIRFCFHPASFQSD